MVSERRHIRATVSAPSASPAPPRASRSALAPHTISAMMASASARSSAPFGHAQAAEGHVPARFFPAAVGQVGDGHQLDRRVLPQCREGRGVSGPCVVGGVRTAGTVGGRVESGVTRPKEEWRTRPGRRRMEQMNAMPP